MALSLSPDDTARLEATTRALLSPLAAPSPDAWMVEAGARMRELFGASLFVATPIPDPDFRPLCPDAPAFGARLEAITYAQTDRSLGFTDPLLEAWFESYGRGLSHSTWSSNARMLDTMGYEMEESLFVVDACRPDGLRDFASMHHQMPAGFASLLVLGERTDGFRFGEAAPDVLRVLSPAFYAGLDAAARLGAHRAALGATLDALAEPVLALDADGRERHRNRALVALLDADPERAAVDLVLWQAARDVRRAAFARRHEARGLAAAAPAVRTAATARGRYTVTPTLLPAGLLGADDMALVSVRAELRPAPPDPAAVAARTGLSAREAEVAVLVADGLTNAQIAERLFVAPGTVKRHVENVLAKLGVPTRAGVAARLADAESPFAGPAS